jgi:hypothetical protein
MLGQWNAYGEGTADTLGTIDIYCTSIQRHDLLGNVQANPGTARLRCPCIFRTIEDLKEIGTCREQNADALILDNDATLIATPFDPHGDWTTRAAKFPRVAK